MFSARDPTDEEIRFVAEIWRAAGSVPIERSLMILMSAITLLIAELEPPRLFLGRRQEGCRIPLQGTAARSGADPPRTGPPPMIDQTELDTMDECRPPAWLAAVLIIEAALACWGVIYALGWLLALLASP